MTAFILLGKMEKGNTVFSAVISFRRMDRLF